MLRLIGLALVAGLTLLAVACSSDSDGQPAAGDDLTRVAEVDGVTVKSTWITEADLTGDHADLSGYSLDEFVLLELSMDTHSGDLNAIDMEQEAALSQGGEQSTPQAWVSLSDNPHHRTGVLVFPRSLDTGPAELIIRIEEVELAFVWEAVPGT